MRPNRMTDATKEEIRPAYKAIEDYTVDQKMTIDEIVVSGNLTYVRVTFDGWLTPRPLKQVKPVRAVGRHMMILERQANNSWKFTREISISPKIDSPK